jgi:twitching motility protein PilT
MEQINGYLQSLISASAYELHFEPNKSPFVLSDHGVIEVSNSPLSGANISQLIFPIIPVEAKQKLPNQPEIEFSYSNPTGNFGFVVKKSPSGFHVIVKPLEVTSGTSSPSMAPSMDPSMASAIPAVTPAPAAYETPVFESNSYADTQEPHMPAQNSTFSVTSGEMTPAQPVQVEESKPPRRTSLDNVFESSSIEANSNSLYESFQDTSIVDDIVPLDDFYFAQPEAVAPVAAASAAPAYDEEVAFAVVGPNPAASRRMDVLFQKMADAGASDLHMSVSMPPMMRKDGKVMSLPSDEPTITADAMRELLTSIMPPKNQKEFHGRHDTDFAYEIPGLARFRCNIFMDRKGIGGVFRIIPTKILTAQQLNLPKAVLDLCNLSKGLVVVTGPTGSGKSTTLAAMMDHINDSRDDHVITIEDPIEFVHENKKCLVNQREVYNHTDSFKDALRAALREDPDILLVGEMRDLETISIAIETAETGHLVFGTLHTTTAPSTVDRIIDQFPADRQQQIRVMLSESLKGVIAQTLLPKKGGGRVAALEVLIVTPAISNLIREGKTFQIPSAMQTGKNIGMTMLNDSMIEFVKQGVVEAKDAYIKAVDKTGFEMLLQRNNLKM